MRVIAGSARGRPLKAPPETVTRPTADKVKGALFSSLEALAYKLGYEREVDDDGIERFAAAQAWPSVLDLYAGSGALAIEALSRGAERAALVEADPRARAILQHNLQRTGLASRAVVHPTRADQALSTLPGRYDLILADPPYADVEAARVLTGLADSLRLSERAILVWEHRSTEQPPRHLGRLNLLHTRRYGAAALSFYSMQSAEFVRAEPARLEGADPEHPERER